MCNHDKEQIKQLIHFKKWFLWYKTLSKEEKEKLKFNRWK